MATSSTAERGPKTPGFALGAVVDFLQKVREGVGFGRASRETVAHALGYSSLNGTSKRAVAALIHFGLLERSGSSAVQISELGKRILLPNNEEEVCGAVAEAVKQPAIYQKLLDRYIGHGLPTLLPNILVRDFGVLANSSEEIARLFRESVEYAGLLRNGVLHEWPEDDSTAAGEGQEPVSSSDGSAAPAEGRRVQDHGPVIPPPVPAGTRGYTIPLDRQGKVATIYIPLPVLPNYLKQIERWATFMSEMSEDEVEE